MQGNSWWGGTSKTKATLANTNQRQPVTNLIVGDVGVVGPQLDGGVRLDDSGGVRLDGGVHLGRGLLLLYPAEGAHSVVRPGLYLAGDVADLAHRGVLTEV